MIQRMRFITFLAASAFLAACATAPPSPPDTASVSASAAPARVTLLARDFFVAAGRADAPSQAEVERGLGEPDIRRREGAGAALTYRLRTCALLLVFTADARNEMRLAQAHPSARRAGDAAPTLEQCAAEFAEPR
jgi:hypothetical protein